MLSNANERFIGAKITDIDVIYKFLTQFESIIAQNSP